MESIEVSEKPFTTLQEDAIMASMICLEEAFMIARKRKDVQSIIDIADKWYGLSQAFEGKEESPKSGFGFSLGIENEQHDS